MSGLAAIFNLDGAPADAGVLERMLSAASYRGRDGFGRFVNGAAAIGYLALNCTPESMREAQPLADETGRFVMSFDGRIDNRTELQTVLVESGVRMRDDTDAELALCAFLQWREDAPRRIIGDFAFLIFDRVEQRMFCARDPFGIRPFYYYRDDRTFICASELHQILADPRVRIAPNEGMIGEIAVQMPANRVETMLAGIMRLAPRHALSVGAGSFRIWRYYEPDPIARIRHTNDDEYGEHYLAVLREAVRARLRSSGRVMIDLSGGLDSSSVLCVALGLVRAGAATAQIEAVSLMRHPDSDESLYVGAVERATGIQATIVEPADADRATLEAQCRHYADLPDFPNAAMGDFDSVLAARGDVRVSISGNGGNEWFSGSKYAYADMLRNFEFASVARRLGRDIVRARSDPSVAPWTTLFITGLWPMVPRRARLIARRLLKPGAPHSEPVTQDFARRIALADRVRVEEPAPRFPTLAQRDLYRTFAAGWLTYPLELGDRWMAARSIEGRHPFFDRRLFEFGLALPEDQRMRGNVERFIARHALRNIVPTEILARKTPATYASCFPNTLEKAGGAAVFNDMETVRLGWFDGQWLSANYAAMIRLYRAGDSRYLLTCRPLWTAFAIEMWFKTMFGAAGQRMHAHDAADDHVGSSYRAENLSPGGSKSDVTDSR